MRALNQEELEQRKRKVLQYVIHEFISSGKPVGSNSIATSSRLGLSPATIRNTLADLENEELIIQPHTSAGRIPTDKGYRMYVDALVELQRLAVQEQIKIHDEYEERIKEIEDLMSQTSRMLSSLSHYTGFVVTPKWEKNIFSSLELIPISSRRILCAMISESGFAKHFIINTNIEIPREKLRGIARLINQSFAGITLSEVKLKMMDRLESVEQEYREIFSLAKEIGEEIRKFSSSELYLDGANHILSLPDFSKTEEFQNLFKMIDEKEMLVNLLEKELLEDSENPESSKGAPTKRKRSSQTSNASSRVQVRIGSENQNKAMRNLSVISSTYRLSDQTVGMLGILGPKRMEYSKMIGLVDYVSQMVNRLIKDFEKRR